MDDISISLYPVYFSIDNFYGSWFGDCSIGLAWGRKNCIWPVKPFAGAGSCLCAENPAVNLTAKLSLRYALCILLSIGSSGLRYWRLVAEPFHFINNRVTTLPALQSYSFYYRKLDGTEHGRA